MESLGHEANFNHQPLPAWQELASSSQLTLTQLSGQPFELVQGNLMDVPGVPDYLGPGFFYLYNQGNVGPPRALINAGGGHFAVLDDAYTTRRFNPEATMPLPTTEQAPHVVHLSPNGDVQLVSAVRRGSSPLLVGRSVGGQNQDYYGYPSSVSNLHFAVQVEYDGRIAIADLASSNGTQVLTASTPLTAFTRLAGMAERRHRSRGRIQRPDLDV